MMKTKRMVYQSVVLGVLLYGAETLVPTQDLVGKLDQFHWRCGRCILGISRTVQWKEHLTTAEVADRFGMVKSIGNLLTQYRLRWMGHVFQMPDTRHPKKLLFVYLFQKHSAHVAKLWKWSIRIWRSIKSVSHHWYMAAQDCTGWRTICTICTNQHMMALPPYKPFVCITCHRSFWRQQEISTNKHTTTCPWQ